MELTHLSGQAILPVIVALTTIWLTVAVYTWLRHQGLWREAMFRAPVLAFESDDWGPGPAEDADRLRELAACARAHHDIARRPLAVTLGVVLASIDTDQTDYDRVQYHRVTLDGEHFSHVRKAILEGVEAGVFFPQLHAAEHFWPPALMAAASQDDSVARWGSSENVPRTEHLPPHLQSRWIDASTLPSKPLPDAAIAKAVEDEVSLFATTFNIWPTVVVPPTFVWDERVEQAWIGQGVRAVITPGCRYESRDSMGKLSPPSKRTRTGECVRDSRAIYLVRDIYFEPSIGHRAEDVVERIVDHARLGRPALVEMHRFNFTDDVEKAHCTLAELSRLIELALRAVPQLQFIPPQKLAHAILNKDPQLLETSRLGKLAVWVRRVWQVPPVRRLAIATLAVIPACLLCAAVTLAANIPRREGRI